MGKLFLLALCLFPGMCLRVGADAPGEALFAKCLAAEKNAGSLKAVAIISRTKAGRRSIARVSLRLEKPNRAFYSLHSVNGKSVAVLVSDGESLKIYDGVTNSYTVLPADGTGMNFAATITPIGGGIETQMFFNPVVLLAIKSASGHGIVIVGAKAIGAVRCQVLQIPRHGTAFGIEIYVGPDNLVRGGRMIGDSQTMETQLVDAQYHAPLAAADFAWTPPAQAKQVAPEKFKP